MVLATCHAGRGKSRIPDSLAQALATHKEPLRTLEEVSEAVLVLSAAAFGGAAREDETLGHPGCSSLDSPLDPEALQA